MGGEGIHYRIEPRIVCRSRGWDMAYNCLVVVEGSMGVEDMVLSQLLDCLPTVVKGDKGWSCSRDCKTRKLPCKTAETPERCSLCCQYHRSQ